MKDGTSRRKPGRKFDKFKNEANFTRVQSAKLSLDCSDVMVIMMIKTSGLQHQNLLSLNNKFSNQYAGPFPVTRKVRQLAYELELPPASRIHPVISVT